jgi:crossover junction endodeoxyribonuclease RuvC
MGHLPSRRELWTHYIADGGRQSKSQLSGKIASYSENSVPLMGTILGIDPSLRGTGMVVVKREGMESFVLKFSDVIDLHSFKGDMSACLCRIFEKLQEVIDQYKPDGVALEQAIYVQNVKIAQIMGAVRGVVLMAVRLKNLGVKEYPPLRVKQAISGYGRANKEQVARMVKSLLKLPESLPYDASDAAAVALCHFFTSCCSEKR